MAQILWFENYQPADAPELGGKNASLGTLLGAGLPVPPGFAVSADCYRKALADGGLTGQIDALIAAVDPRDTASVAAAGERARALIGALRMPADLDAAIRGAYARLCEQCGDARLPVAVRSSATCEDQPDASFAGEHDTYLWVRGGDAVVAHVLRCWASLFTDRGIAYRLERGYRQHGAAMSVGVQQMVRPRAAGVAFTLNPLNGDRSQIAIDASWGFGEAVVSGEVTPDNFLVDKVMGAITRRTISAKTLEYRLTAADAVTAVPVEAERQSVPCLSDDEIAGRGQAGPAGGEALQVPAGRGVGDRRGAGHRRGAECAAAAEPPRDGVEPSPAAGRDLQRGPDHQHGADPAAPLARHARWRLLNHYQ